MSLSGKQSTTGNVKVINIGQQSPQISHPHRFFIAGNWRQPSSNARFRIVSPATEEQFFEVAEAQEADMLQAVAAAREAFDSGPWPKISHEERAGYLRALGAEIGKRTAELSHIWAGEMGALYSLAKMIVPSFQGIFDYYAGLARTFPFVEYHKSASAGAGYIVREPVGVVAAIVPWNGPLMLASWKVAPALLAGCTVVLKASPEAPGTLYVLAEAAEAIGLPPGVLNLITAERAVSELLVRHAGVDKVSFTGSTTAGRRIGAICGDRIARCTLELGGKSPAIILDDYDVETFARAISASSAILSGQVCAALTRVIVTGHRQAALVDTLRSEFSKICVGDPFEEKTNMGPLATVRQRDRVEGYIAKGLAEGAGLAAGGGRPKHLERGFYIEPTIFSNVDNESTIAREEIFGPVISVIPAKDEAHAIELANQSPYGLNSAVFTNDRERAFHVARQLRIGTVSQNGLGPDFSIAFGGFKQSGIGREGGIEGLMPYLETKTVLLTRQIAP
jgi:aldehyde dehydrogenase (NAD+)